MHILYSVFVQYALLVDLMLFKDLPHQVAGENHHAGLSDGCCQRQEERGGKGPAWG